MEKGHLLEAEHFIIFTVMPDQYLLSSCLHYKDLLFPDNLAEDSCHSQGHLLEQAYITG